MCLCSKSWNPVCKLCVRPWKIQLGNGMGLQNPHGSQVWVVMGTSVGMDFPTHEQQNEPKMSQNSWVLSELWSKLWTGSVLTITHPILTILADFWLFLMGKPVWVMGMGHHGYRCGLQHEIPTGLPMPLPRYDETFWDNDLQCFLPVIWA